MSATNAKTKQGEQLDPEQKIETALDKTELFLEKYTKQLLRQLNLENPGVKERMFTAIRTGNLKGWPAVDHPGKGAQKEEGKDG